MGRAGTFVVMAEVPAFLYPLCPPKGDAAAERQYLQALLRAQTLRQATLRTPQRTLQRTPQRNLLSNYSYEPVHFR
jgi:hypothetical protein